MKKGESDEYWKANPEIDGYPIQLAEDDAYEAVIALEDAREEIARAEHAREDARKRILTEGVVLRGALIGWRGWDYNVSEQALESTIASTVWPDDLPLRADGVDTEEYGHGIYSFKRPRQAFGWNGPARIIGSVWLWGTVYEFTYGYKAEFAEVRSINYIPRHAIGGFPFLARKRRRQLRQKYGVL